MGDLERILPEDLKRQALTLGSNRTSPSTELVLPYADALRAVAIAAEHEIAVLGLEAFEVQKDGLLTVGLADASSYVPFTGNWKAYVATINAEAERWLNEHRLGENHGYILTSTSQMEFAMLPDRLK
ncbi:MAG: hypothetical protein ACREP9_13865 [Candidatus Dormibacteraceae bacterium]